MLLCWTTLLVVRLGHDIGRGIIGHGVGYCAAALSLFVDSPCWGVCNLGLLR